MNRALSLFSDQCSGVSEVIGLYVEEFTPQDSVLEVVGGHQRNTEGLPVCSNLFSWSHMYWAFSLPITA